MRNKATETGLDLGNPENTSWKDDSPEKAEGPEPTEWREAQNTGDMVLTSEKGEAMHGIETGLPMTDRLELTSRLS